LNYCSLGYFYYFCNVVYHAFYKNFNIAMKKLFSVALIAIMMFSVSCEPAQTDNSNEKAGVTVLSDNLINVPREGGDYEIFYTIKGSSTKVDVSTDNPEMFNVINTSAQSIVRLSVADNSTMPAREAKITIACGGASADHWQKEPENPHDSVSNPGSGDRAA
jgi:hypothetical protein